MKTAITIIVIAIIVGLLVVPKLGLFNHAAENAPAKMNAAAQPVQVMVHVIKPSRLENKVKTTGTVMANEEVSITTEIAGKITMINFKEGAEVNKGQLLLKINDADLIADLNKLQYSQKLAKETEGRQKSLLDKGGISRQDYDNALTNLKTLEADIQHTQVMIDKCSLVAPFSGYIGMRYVSEGSYVSPNTKITDLVSLDPVKIDFSVPEKYTSFVSIGQKINFTVSGTKDTYTATVYAIDPRIDAVSRTLRLRASCPNKDRKIMPGSFAEIELSLSRNDNAIMVPTEAIIPILKGQKVFKVLNGMAKDQLVETGIRNDSTIEITKGLQPGDSIITIGIMQVKPGAMVKVIK